MMKRMVTVLVTLLSALPAWADGQGGLVLRPDQLVPAERATLQRLVQADRQARPGAYDVVAVAKGCRPDGWMSARSPEPNCSRELRALGPAGLLPMLSALALEWSPQGLSAEPANRAREERALAVGLLEAVGGLRDVRARGVLHALWKSAETRPELQAPLGRQMSVARAAAEALGRLGGAQELQVLQAHLRPADALYLPAIAGVGVCKRTDAAPLLVAALNGAPDESVQRHVLQAMGALGSSWSWQALGRVRQEDGLKVRARLTDALLPWLAKTRGETRERVVQALQLADHPDLPARLGQLRAGADAGLQHDIDDLLGRVARAHAVP